MKKPNKSKIVEFIKEAFEEEHAKSLLVHNLWEWEKRFESPCKVWSHSDYDRRDTLRKMFPEKFRGLDKDTNLNNQEYQIPKYTRW